MRPDWGVKEQRMLGASLILLMIFTFEICLKLSVLAVNFAIVL